jgi:hypothetical protein
MYWSSHWGRCQCCCKQRYSLFEQVFAQLCGKLEPGEWNRIARAAGLLNVAWAHGDSQIHAVKFSSCPSGAARSKCTNLQFLRSFFFFYDDLSQSSSQQKPLSIKFLSMMGNNLLSRLKSRISIFELVIYPSLNTYMTQNDARRNSIYTGRRTIRNSQSNASWEWRRNYGSTLVTLKDNIPAWRF